MKTITLAELLKLLATQPSASVIGEVTSLLRATWWVILPKKRKTRHGIFQRLILQVRVVFIHDFGGSQPNTSTKITNLCTILEMSSNLNVREIAAAIKLKTEIDRLIMISRPSRVVLPIENRKMQEKEDCAVASPPATRDFVLRLA